MIFPNLSPETESSLFDICIVGSGPAGMTIALGLAKEGVKVCLLEGGGRNRDPRQDETYGFKSVGSWNYNGLGRSRFLGGSSNCWGGQCSRFDEIDFETRAWIPHSGWPIQLSDIERHYAETISILDLREWGPYEVKSEFPENQGYRGKEFAPKRWLVSDSLRFAKKFDADLRTNSKLHVFLNANVVDIQLSENRNEATSVTCILSSGKKCQVKARHYVLACGGIENPRILLNARSQLPSGVGNETDCVGRYFMDHLNFFGAAQLVPATGTTLPPGFSLTNYGFLRRGYWNLQLSPEFQREKQLPNMAIHFDVEEAVGGPLPWGDGFGGDGRAHTFSLGSELRPQPQNRIQLSQEKDFLGLQKTEVNISIPEEDILASSNALLHFAQFLGRTGLGRIKINNRLSKIMAASHHMGTTRMGSDPKSSVVDKNLRLHGVHNFYCAGSSVFPTGGCVNPTFTIVALALRLKEKLLEQLKS